MCRCIYFLPPPKELRPDTYLESKVVGTLRVPLYFYPCWRDLERIGHYQERHTECAYYFSYLPLLGYSLVHYLSVACTSGSLKTKQNSRRRLK